MMLSLASPVRCRVIRPGDVDHTKQGEIIGASEISRGEWVYVVMIEDRQRILEAGYVNILDQYPPER